MNTENWLPSWEVWAQTGLSSRQLGRWEKEGSLTARRFPLMSPHTFYDIDAVLLLAARQIMMGRLRVRLAVEIPHDVLSQAADSLGVDLQMPRIQEHLSRSLPIDEE